MQEIENKINNQRQTRNVQINENSPEVLTNNIYSTPPLSTTNFYYP